MRNSDINKLRQRDAWCWHCGQESDLVPHHRANRGFGGSKVLDSLQNVILVCAQYNGDMESNADTANWARELGHKLSKFAWPAAPVFDVFTKKWYNLDEKGNKHEGEPPSFLL